MNAIFKSAWTIGHVAGIPIKLHISLLLVLPLFSFIFGNNIRALTEVMGIDPKDLYLGPYLIGFLLGVGLFASIALHELGHSLTALRRGMKIRDITLMLLGGIAQLEEISKRPGDELVVAITGPLVSLALGGILLGGRYLAPAAFLDLQLFLLYLGQMNIFLALFNLLPAFPTDGGRVFRALLAGKRPYLEATRIAVAVGQSFAWFFGIIGILSGQIFLLVIAFFIYMAANQEYQTGLLKSTLSGFTVADLMTREVATVPADFTIQQLLETMYEKRHTGYPVVDRGAVVGCVTMEDIRKVAPEDRASYTVHDIMSTELHRIHPRDDINEALKDMSNLQIGRLLVFDRERLVGIITRSDIIKGFKLRQLDDLPQLLRRTKK